MNSPTPEDVYDTRHWTNGSRRIFAVARPRAGLPELEQIAGAAGASPRHRRVCKTGSNSEQKVRKVNIDNYH